MAIERATLSDDAAPVRVIGPSGEETEIALRQSAPGVWHAQAEAEAQGLYEARSGNLRAFAAVGPLNPREAAALNADPDILRPFAEAAGGSVFLTGEDGTRLPRIRRIDRGARAGGGDWIGVKRNGAYVVRAAVASPLGPGWAWAVAGLALLMLGWRRESA